MAYNWNGPPPVWMPKQPKRCPHGTLNGCSLCDVQRWERYRKIADALLGVIAIGCVLAAGLAIWSIL